MSIDPAHSLADSFDLETGLFHGGTSEPVEISSRLSVHNRQPYRTLLAHRSAGGNAGQRRGCATWKWRDSEFRRKPRVSERSGTQGRYTSPEGDGE